MTYWVKILRHQTYATICNSIINLLSQMIDTDYLNSQAHVSLQFFPHQYIVNKIKMNKNTTQSEQFQNPIERVQMIPLIHCSRSRLATGTSIKSGEIIYPISLHYFQYCLQSKRRSVLRTPMPLLLSNFKHKLKSLNFPIFPNLFRIVLEPYKTLQPKSTLPVY